MHTQEVRNVGYLGQMSRAYHDLLEPLDTEFHEAFGVRGSAIVECFTRTADASNDRMNQYLDRLREPIAASSPTISKYNSLIKPL